jgi:hypothetical protein
MTTGKIIHKQGLEGIRLPIPVTSLLLRGHIFLCKKLHLNEEILFLLMCEVIVDKIPFVNESSLHNHVFLSH